MGSSDSSGGRNNAATISGPTIGNMNTSLCGWILNIEGAGLLSLSCSNNTADAPLFLANRMAEGRNKRAVKVFYNRVQELCRSNSKTIYAPCGAGVSASTFYLMCPGGAADFCRHPHPVSDSVLLMPLLDGIGRKWRGDMKTFHILKASLIALALLRVPNVFAANRGQLHVSSPEDVAGQTLNAGDIHRPMGGRRPER